MEQGIRSGPRGKVGAGRKGRDRELEEGRGPGADREDRLGQGGRVGAGNQGLGREYGLRQGFRGGAGSKGCGREGGLGHGIRGEQSGKVGAGRKGWDRELEEGREPCWGRESGADREERLGQGGRVVAGN